MGQFVVDAFTDTVFKGNPAAICVLEDWIPESLMMSIALENNFSETANEDRVTLAGQAALYAISDLVMEGISSNSEGTP